MLDATPVPQPERERPDLFIRLYMDESSPVDDNRFGTSWALLTMPVDAGGDWFRLPSTRRAKAVEELMGALEKLQDLARHGTALDVLEETRRVLAARAALLALDAKNEQEHP